MAVRFAHVRHLEERGYRHHAARVPGGPRRRAGVSRHHHRGAALRQHLEVMSRTGDLSFPPPPSTAPHPGGGDTLRQAPQRGHQDRPAGLCHLLQDRDTLEVHAACLWWEAPDTAAKKAAIHATARTHGPRRCAPRPSTSAPPPPPSGAPPRKTPAAKGAHKLLRQWGRRSRRRR